MSDDLEWLAGWYRAQCDVAWLERRGVVLESVENPGWWLRVDLAGTDLEARAADGVLRFEGEPARDRGGEVVLVGKPGESYTAPGERWFICGIEGGVFHAAGDPTRLGELVRAFRAWAELGGA